MQGSNKYANVSAALAETSALPLVRDINGQVLSIANIAEKDTFISQDAGQESFRLYFRGLEKFLPSGEYQNFKANIHTLTFNDPVGKVPAGERHSLFPIHKEMFFYVSRLIKDLSAEPVDKKNMVFNQVYPDLCAFINADIAKFLNSRSGITISDINTYIDHKREKYAMVAEALVASKLAVDQHKLVDAKTVTKNFKDKTATDMDMIETNHVTGLVTYTDAVTDSSHSKKDKPPAITRIRKYALGVYDTPIQTQYRTPSLVKAKLTEQTKLFGETEHDIGNLTVTEQVTDFVQEIVKRREAEKREKNAPIVYNLLTSLSSANDQYKTAQLNFQAMHEYNKTAFDESEKQTSPLYYVMNVPVNQSGKTLSLKSGDSLAKEAAFFADLAVLDTMPEDFLKHGEGIELAAIKDLYKQYLKDSERPPYFCESTQGKQAVAQMISLKDVLQGVVNAVQTSTQEEKMRKAFLKLYLEAFNGKMTLQKELSSLIQGMFLALNDNDNLKGCKSAVDRFTFAEGLNNLFLSYLKGAAKVEDSAMQEKLTNSIENYTQNKITAEAFAIDMHTINNQYKAYDSSMDAAFNDANDAKHIVSGKANPLKAAWHTNKFVPSLYTNIRQDSAPSMQAEKAVAKRAVKLRKIAGQHMQYIETHNNKQRGVIESEGTQSLNSVSDYKALCKNILLEYSQEWGWRHHRKAARDTMKSLDTVSSVEDMTKKIDELRQKMYAHEKFNVGGALHSRVTLLLSEAPKYSSPGVSA